MVPAMFGGMTVWKVRRNPDDIEMERETTLRDFQEWFIYSLGLQGWEPPTGAPLAEAIHRVRDDEQFKQMLSPIFDEMLYSDSLWLCRSRIFGPLLGHKGLALVREGRPLIYVQMIYY